MKLKSNKRMPTQSWSTRIDRRLRVAVPPSAVSWMVGQRLFWLFDPDRRGSAVVSDSPRGTLLGGRYLSTTVQRTRLRRQRQTGGGRVKLASKLALAGIVTPKLDRPLSIEEMKP